MNEEFFVVTKEGTTLTIELGPKLNANNAPALTEELSKYVGQDIEKIVFDATGLFFIWVVLRRSSRRRRRGD